MTRATALAEPMGEAEASPWRPMREAPKNRPILLRAKWAGRPVAIVGEYVAVHGAWCAQPVFGQGDHQIFSDGWAELPPLLEA